MRWLITGGAGFIGSHFLDWVRTQAPSDFLLCYDKLTYSANPFWASAADELVIADICDTSRISKEIERLRPQVIVNFAAESHVDRSYSQIPAFTRTNVDGVVSILEAIRAIDPDILLVQISTDEVYGDDPVPHSDYSQLNPKNPYAVTKAAAEQMVKVYRRAFDLRHLIVRSSNNWGPRQHPEKFIPAILQAKISGNPMVVHGYHLKRDWIHVLDNVRAIYELIQGYQHIHSGVFNIATGVQYTLRQVLDRAGGVPHILQLNRPGVDQGYWVDPTHTWDLLGWRPPDFMADERWDAYFADTTERSEEFRELRLPVASP